MRLAELGELGLLRELERRGLAREIGDDVARLTQAPDRGELIVTQDALVEGVHFRFDWTSWRDLGYKAAAVNISDLAAAGAEPEALVVTFAAPPGTELDDAVALYEGISETGVAVVGGDTSSAPQVMLSVTALGYSERVPGRAGAQPGDVLVVSGPLGASAAGFLALQRGVESPLRAAHLRPPLRVAEGRALARTAHAMLDLSDGLALDASRLAERSGCRVVIDLEQLPIAEGVAALANELDEDVHRLAVGFGEDYELLAALLESDAGGWTVIGRCEQGEGVELRIREQVVAIRGFEHFNTT